MVWSLGLSRACVPGPCSCLRLSFRQRKLGRKLWGAWHESTVVNWKCMDVNCLATKKTINDCDFNSTAGTHSTPFFVLLRTKGRTFLALQGLETYTYTICRLIKFVTLKIWSLIGFVAFQHILYCYMQWVSPVRICNSHGWAYSFRQR